MLRRFVPSFLRATQRRGLASLGFAPLARHVKPVASLTQVRALSVPSGATEYNKLYPEKSSDGFLRLGNIAPDFSAETTKGPMNSFHEWIGDSWAILFSHPADFTPVCTTEIGRVALKYDWLAERNCKIATLSVDPVDSHNAWLQDVVAHCENNIKIDFPIIADPDRKISVAYNMFDPGNLDDDGLPLTIRAVFIIGPDKKIKLILNYPASVGRNMDEICRCVEALQLSAKESIATPANWPNNHESIGMKGSVFILPTVTAEDAKEHFPGHKTCEVPSGKEYLRLASLESLGKK
uniref:Thioredoxin domain-containing protein n=1 Tax=Lotharella globosa TaxID=91324 RepID=A0A7S3Z8F8_9EUKA|mmetsp:Transcript_13027/g.24646  ORF Transcript_13027/g.24646 Transcript_13027/m.24646 type:complete len:294 (+) Transcript_13027:61-942(+)